MLFIYCLDWDSICALHVACAPSGSGHLISPVVAGRDLTTHSLTLKILLLPNMRI